MREREKETTHVSVHVHARVIACISVRDAVVDVSQRGERIPQPDNGSCVHCCALARLRRVHLQRNATQSHETKSHGRKEGGGQILYHTSCRHQ